MSDLKLLCCPFCGGDAEVMENSEGQACGSYPRFRVWCTECLVDSPDLLDTESDVIAAWNRRAPQSTTDARVEAQQAENKRLREALANLEGAATRVSNCGAVTGPQWTRLSSALISARAALREEPTP